MGYPVRKQYGR